MNDERGRFSPVSGQVHRRSIDVAVGVEKHVDPGGERRDEELKCRLPYVAL